MRKNSWIVAICLVCLLVLASGMTLAQDDILSKLKKAGDKSAGTVNQAKDYAEAIKGLNKKLDGLAAKLDKQQQSIQDTLNKLNELEAKVNGLEGNLKGIVDAKTKELETKLVQKQAELVLANETQIKDVEAKLTEKITDLENNFSTIVSGSAGNQEKFDSMTSDIEALKKGQTETKATVTEHGNTLSTVPQAAKVNALENDLAELKKKSEKMYYFLIGLTGLLILMGIGTIFTMLGRRASRKH